jgi:hypothetical protein
MVGGKLPADAERRGHSTWTRVGDPLQRRPYAHSKLAEPPEHSVRLVQRRAAALREREVSTLAPDALGADEPFLGEHCEMVPRRPHGQIERSYDRAEVIPWLDRQMLHDPTSIRLVEHVPVQVRGDSYHLCDEQGPL